MWTPFPLLLAALGFLLLLAPRISQRWWAKAGRIGCILLALINFNSLQSQGDRKVCAAQKKVQAKAIADFTAHVDALLSQGHIDEARNLLTTFTQEYPLVAGDDPGVQALVRDLKNRK